MIIWENYINNETCFGAPAMSKTTWKFMCDIYGKEFVIDSLTDWLCKRTLKEYVKFPRSNFTLKDCEKRFIKLYNNSLEKYWVDDDCFFKNTYKNIGTSLGVLQSGNYYNEISNFFQMDSRLKSTNYDSYSAHTVWTGVNIDHLQHYKILRKVLSGLSKFDIKKLDYSSYKTCFNLTGTVYIPSQFKVHTSKQIYQYFKAKRVIDFSCGWGDRLAGFFCTPETVEYLGTDPNLEIYNTYSEQCRYYDRWRHEIHGISKIHNSKDYKEPTIKFYNDHFIFKSISTGITVIIYNKPAEDMDWNFEQKYDLIFTSPPYYNLEKYALNSSCQVNQSWFRYRTQQEWLDKFLKVVLSKTTNILVKNGNLAINIIDPKNMKISIYDFLRENIKYDYLGYFSMKISKRPNTFDNPKSLAEPVWIWKK